MPEEIEEVRFSNRNYCHRFIFHIPKSQKLNRFSVSKGASNSINQSFQLHHRSPNKKGHSKGLKTKWVSIEELDLAIQKHQIPNSAT